MAARKSSASTRTSKIAIIVAAAIVVLLAIIGIVWAVTVHNKTAQEENAELAQMRISCAYYYEQEQAERKNFDAIIKKAQDKLQSTSAEEMAVPRYYELLDMHTKNAQDHAPQEVQCPAEGTPEYDDFEAVMAARGKIETNLDYLQRNGSSLENSMAEVDKSKKEKDLGITYDERGRQITGPEQSDTH